MAAVECREVLSPGTLPVDTKWGFREFGYPMTLQNFNKSPKLEIRIPLQSLNSQHEARLTRLCPATSRASSKIQHHCTSCRIQGWDITYGVGSRRNMHGITVYCMPWDRTRGQTKPGLCLLNMCSPEHTKQLAVHKTGRCPGWAECVLCEGRWNSSWLSFSRLQNETGWERP